MEHVQVEFERRAIADLIFSFFQIDLLDMTEVAYGAKTYGLMLTVQCMFSRFMFARALSCKDRGLITRHLMDIFSTFGPPGKISFNSMA